MLQDLENLRGYALRARDGDIGTIKDFYFDDDRWVIRYLVVETGSWLASRKVLISPMSAGEPNRGEKVIPVSITREQVRNSPDIDTDRPVSRQHEIDYLGYYGYPAYWDSVGLWGAGTVPGLLVPEGGLAPPMTPLGGAPEMDRSIAAERAARHEHDDPHLRSCRAVTGYRIKARDGEIGHVRQWLVDSESWTIRYLVVHTSQWWTGHDVLIAPEWIDEVSWTDRIVVTRMTRNAVQTSPSWNPAFPPDRTMEAELYKHHQRTGYW